MTSIMTSAISCDMVRDMSNAMAGQLKARWRAFRSAAPRRANIAEALRLSDRMAIVTSICSSGLAQKITVFLLCATTISSISP
jgi:hypothetical protein